MRFLPVACLSLGRDPAVPAAEFMAIFDKVKLGPETQHKRLLEGDTRLFVAREKLRHQTPKKTPNYPLTLDAADIPSHEPQLSN
jgi:hypothetical protein